MKKIHARTISLIIVFMLVACIVMMYIPSCRASLEQPENNNNSSVASVGGADKPIGSISIDTQKDSDTPDKATDSENTTPVEDLNKALSTLGLAYQADMFGVVKPNFDAVAQNAKITKIDTFDTGEADASTMLVVPFYKDCEITIEKVKFDGISIIVDSTVFTSTSTDDYALSVTAARPAVMPNYRVSIKHDGITYSYLIKGEPSATEEYIR